MLDNILVTDTAQLHAQGRSTHKDSSMLQATSRVTGTTT